MSTEFVLVSACLLGAKVTYEGKNNLLPPELLEYLLNEVRVIPFCPEIAGGLSTPRPPAEICGGSGEDVLSKKSEVRTRDNQNVTENFLLGAEAALKIARTLGIKTAILKDGSPSCGSTYIYDGTFSQNKIIGMGVTTTLLSRNGVKILNESNFISFLERSELV